MAFSIDALGRLVVRRKLEEIDRAPMRVRHSSTKNENGHIANVAKETLNRSAFSPLRVLRFTFPEEIPQNPPLRPKIVQVTSGRLARQKIVTSASSTAFVSIWNEEKHLFFENRIIALLEMDHPQFLRQPACEVLREPLKNPVPVGVNLGIASLKS